MAQKYVNNKYILLIDDIQFHLHKRSCYIDQLQKLCEIEFQYDQYQSIPREYPLFDCLIVVGLQKSAGSFKPFIKMKYPNSYAEIPHGIEMLCFPDAEYLSPNESVEDNILTKRRTHFLVLTDPNGCRRFGYCRRIIPGGEKVSLPLAYCIISSKRSRIYPMILKELENQQHHGAANDDNTAEEMFRLLYVQSFPKTNNQPIFITHSGKIFKQIRRPLDTTLEVNHVHFITSNIGIDSLVKLFLGVLQEKKIIILGSSLAEVSTSVESLSALLSPFVWQHTLIPLLPSHLIEILEAPTPYLIGVHHADYLEFDIFDDIDDVMIAHLDHDGLLICPIEDFNIKYFMENELVKDLIKRLQAIESFIAIEQTTDCTSSLPPALNIMVAEAFSKFFLSFLGDYNQYIVRKNSNIIFQFELNVSLWCKGRPLEQKIWSIISLRHSQCLQAARESIKDFLNIFLQTTMFQIFINSKLNEERISTKKQDPEQQSEEYLVKIF